MTLKARLAWIVILWMSALVVSYSLLLFGEVRERAEVETEGALPWIVELLPGRIDALAQGENGAIEQLVNLVRSLDSIRHVTVELRTPGGELLARAPSRARALPGWLRRNLAAPSSVRKSVSFGAASIAYFEVRAATEDEYAEVWDDFVRNSLLVVVLSSLAGLAIVGLAFRAFQPVDRIRDALRKVGSGARDARLPRFRTQEMDEIATAFNRMASEIEAAQTERQTLMRKLVASEEHTRRSVAHDLHDDLSPYLVALQPVARVLQVRCDRRNDLEDIAPLVQTLVAHQSKMLSTLRGILVGLHPPELEAMGLRGALDQLLAQRGGDTEGRVRFRLDAPGTWTGFDAVLDASLYRIAQECVTNALRHARPSWFELRIEHQPDAIELQARNDGVDTAAAATVRAGLGTMGMRERCIALGGSFDSRATPHGIWQVRIRLPLERPQPAGHPP